MKLKFSHILLALTLLPLTFFSCNDTESSEEYLWGNTAVKSFTLQKNDSVLTNLNLTFFSIDLINGLIYNADSLPKGTDVSKLAVTIDFSGQLSEALIYVKDSDTAKCDTIDYADTEQQDEKIDFTAEKVTLFIRTTDETITKEYDIKVNVHQVEPNPLQWSDLAVANDAFPIEGALHQTNVVMQQQQLYALLQSTQGYHLFTATAPQLAWSELPLPLPNPSIRNFAAGDSLYLLDANGTLYTSINAIDWVNTHESFYSIIGVYPPTAKGGERLLAIRKGVDGAYSRVTYPATTESAVPTDFPVSSFSNPLTYTPSDYSHDVQLMMVGGKKSNDRMTNAVWGYDGNNWSIAPINNVPLESSPITPREGAAFISYETLPTDTLFGNHDSHPTWIIIGGHNGGNYMNDVLVSYDSGISWREADEELQLPSDLVGRAFASALTITHPVTTQRSSATAAWRMLEPLGEPRTMTRTAEELDAPYIYMFGGKGLIDGAPATLNQAWRGVILRHTFAPIP